MTSKYAKKVQRLLRKIYPVPQRIIKEASLGEFSKDISLSKKTKGLIKMYEARLGRMKVDFWVKHQVAIEVHGEQHEQEIKFSNDIEDTAAELQRRKGLDLVKQEVLKESGVPIVIVWYYEIKDLDAAGLKEKIQAAQQVADIATPRYIRRSKCGQPTPRVSSLGAPRRTWEAKRSTRLGIHRQGSLNKPGDVVYSKKRKGNKSLASSTIRKASKGDSKLSRDWKQYKKRQEEEKE